MYSREEMEAFLNSGKISGGVSAAIIRQLLASEERLRGAADKVETAYCQEFGMADAIKSLHEALK